MQNHHAYSDSSSEEEDSDGDEITMGGYTDLPPEERPGYVAPAGSQKSKPKSKVASPTAPRGPTFTPFPQWGYNAPSAPVAHAVRAPPSAAGYNYAEIKNFQYSAKPVVQKEPPAVRHSRRPSGQLVQPPFPVGHPGAQGYTQSPQSYMQTPQPQYPASHGQYQSGPPPPPQGPPQNMGMPPPLMGPSPSVGPPPPMGPPPGNHGNMAPPPPMAPPPAMGPPPGNHGTMAPPPTQPHQQSKLPPGAIVKAVAPGGHKAPSPPSNLRPHARSINGRPADLRAPSPSGLGSRMNRLSVSGNRPDIQTIVPGGMPPPSPLLEAYKGTWQSLSPMPTAMMMGGRDYDDDIDDLPPLSPRVSRTSIHRGASFIRRHSRSPDFKEKKTKKKTVTLYDEQAETDAHDIAAELSRSHPNNQVLIDIMPNMSHDQMLELRTAYKRVCKIQGRGINIAKHIKLKTTGNFCKICYVTALGRWESEGYWANFWYQSNSSRRELLIESLMGRANTDIRKIKDSFKDKRYNDDLVRCMDKELKADKFRVAVLMALEERRQEENDVMPIEYRNRDVDTLYSALRRREGGETAILEIVVQRSDAHLRECLRTYERKYQGNFAKDCLRKSHNLVGEVVAHILNGVINRPARDAMLLHHALSDLAPIEDKHDNPRSSKGDVTKDKVKKDRYELLISRLVRLHWERLHFLRVKEEYKDKYGHFLEEDVEDYVRGDDFREFCLVLCESAR
ncbi:hypothetical protein BLS_008312 [Venturia inaequalis]|uniref:Annexin n=1 Tax=Venturia inaequalis TaxID=5025 RepID=A0A8H3Z6W0_VENIN|nr:hypothetical protein BLS_008312 [Venturia inaequalis]